MDAIVALAGFLVGGVVGITGVGGGALMTPFLIAYGVPPVTAVGTDLAYAAVTKAGGAWCHHRRGTVDWAVASRLAAGSVTAAGLTLAVLAGVGGGSAEAGRLISATLGVTLVLTALAVLGRGRLARRPAAPAPAHRRWSVLVGAAIGVLVTLSSVGAGALGAAALMLLYPRLSAARVVGTDLAHAVLLAGVAAAGHLQLGSVDGSLLASLLAGSLPGVALGTRMGARLSDVLVQRVLAGVLLSLGLSFAL